jgi:hypothetical protein
VGLWLHELPAQNITFSWNLIADALNLGGNNNMGSLVGTPTTPADMTNIVYHHNVFANQSHRLPEIKIKSTKVINNIIYHWKWRGTTLSGGVIADIIGNELIAGPTPSKYEYQPIGVRTDEYLIEHGYAGDPTMGPSGAPSIYVTGNTFTSNAKSDEGYPTTTDPNSDNWNLISIIDNAFQPIDTKYRRFTPLAPYAFPISIYDVTTLKAKMLGDVGNSKRVTENGVLVNNRGLIDSKVLSEVQDDIGTMKSFMSDTLGVSNIGTNSGYLDSDHDGMSDKWEIAHGLNYLDASDAAKDRDNDGYTNIEEFIYGISPVQ